MFPVEEQPHRVFGFEGLIKVKGNGARHVAGTDIEDFGAEVFAGYPLAAAPLFWR